MHRSHLLMQAMNEFLPTTPFDIYSLHLLRLVIREGSFTKAAQVARLTQSAITRQIQGMETRLGVALLERTTRSVRPTEAGDFLARETDAVLGGIELTLRRLREEFVLGQKQVRFGVSRTIGLAYLPGFIFQNRHRKPEVNLRVIHDSSSVLIDQLECGELDLAVFCPPKRLPRGLGVTHRFRDDFICVAPRNVTLPTGGWRKRSRPWTEWINAQTWILIEDRSNTGGMLRRFLDQQGHEIAASMEADNFDLIVNLVALGLGVSIVPQRALALYSRQRKVQRIPMPAKFSRELVVVTRRQHKLPQHVVDFIGHILF